MKKNTKVIKKVSPTYVSGLYADKRYRDKIQALLPCCAMCGSLEDLNLHRRVLIGQIIEEYNIMNTEQALKCDKLFDPINSIALCKTCYNHARLYMYDAMIDGIKDNKIPLN